MSNILLRHRGIFLTKRNVSLALQTFATKGTKEGADVGLNITRQFLAIPSLSRICCCRSYCTSLGSNDDSKSTQSAISTSEPESRTVSNGEHSKIADSSNELQKNLKIAQDEKDVLVRQNNRLTEELQILKQLIEQANIQVPVTSTSESSDKTKPVDAVVAKLAKEVQKKKKRTYDSKGNTEIEYYRVVNDYLLTQKDLEKVPRKKSRSSVSHQSVEFLFRVTDVEKRAIEKWGSLENVEKEKRRRERYAAMGAGGSSPIFPKSEPILIFTGEGKKTVENSQFKEFIKDPSVSVILFAVGVNLFNTCLKGYIWSMTGSPSMFSETIHSAADTMNQMLLLYGQYWSKKQADDTHPYGFGIAKNVTALISGVFIFGVGAGGSLYHALIDYLHPEPPVDMFWSILAMVASLVAEGGSFYYAYHAMKEKAKERGKHSVWQYVKSGKDPNVAVVLCEDGAAVLGNIIAISAMAATQYTGQSIFDTLGAFSIGGLLAAVSVFLIKSNTDILIQKSLPESDRRLLRQFLEDRPEIRSVQDVKATDSGTDVRFKAEVSFDGVVIAQMYVEQNRDKIRQDLNNLRIHTEEGLDEFMEIHGPGMLDLVGICIDRIEVDMKKHFNNVHKIKLRHVDLEPI